MIKPVNAKVSKVPKTIMLITEIRFSSNKDKCITTPTPTGINSSGR